MTEPEAAKKREAHDETKSKSKSPLPRRWRFALLVRLNEREVEGDEDGNDCDKRYNQRQGDERSLHQLRPGGNVRQRQRQRQGKRHKKM